MVYEQTPKYMRWAKVPVVKAKVGPKVMTLMADERAFQMLPVKTEAKVVVSGIYITAVKGVRGPSAAEFLLCRRKRRVSLQDSKKKRKQTNNYRLSGHNTKRISEFPQTRTLISVF